MSKCLRMTVVAILALAVVSTAQAQRARTTERDSACQPARIYIKFSRYIGDKLGGNITFYGRTGGQDNLLYRTFSQILFQPIEP